MKDAAQKNYAGNAVSLIPDALAQIDAAIARPSYDRKSLGCGIVHMSLGGFHRSHQALYIYDLMEQSLSDWLVSAVGLLPNDAANIKAMTEQDSLDTILERAAGGDITKICGGIKEVLHAPAILWRPISKRPDIAPRQRRRPAPSAEELLAPRRHKVLARGGCLCILRT